MAQINVLYGVKLNIKEFFNEYVSSELKHTEGDNSEISFLDILDHIRNLYPGDSRIKLLDVVQEPMVVVGMDVEENTIEADMEECIQSYLNNIRGNDTKYLPLTFKYFI